ncbi:carbon monoxide dehydrogenase [Notoacmeibacter marinus]|uniref:Carbon monoxide dehydrogenase n=1 Tax=Notoacmeibacter marinus TaxID=1876515 RepID=A0A231V0L8_9HYPH|nr:carbon monoxide dehydrogenase subunit G [Notoacmeibacter marinus]OXT01738.1 carbon monoxide dehydrogenase [Notoacmeibacter marinus]
MAVEIEGEETINAPVATVWAALNDPNVLKECIPGCDELNKTSDTEMEAKVTLKIGPIKSTFSGQVELKNINAPTSYTIEGKGDGGIAGFAKGGADVELHEHEGGTLLKYKAKADVGGKMAMMGSRLIQSTSKKLAGQFFSCMNAKISDGYQPPEPNIG